MRSITFVLWMIRNVIILVNWSIQISILIDIISSVYIYIYTHTLVIFYVHKILDFSIYISEITIQPRISKCLFYFKMWKYKSRKTQQCFNALSQLYIERAEELSQTALGNPMDLAIRLLCP